MTFGGAPDVGLSRASTGTLSVNGGSPGTLAALTAGSVNALSLANPANPSVTPQTASIYTWTYAVAARLADGALTTSSATGSTSTGCLDLTTANCANVITWTSVPNAYDYTVYRTYCSTGGGVPSTIGLIATVAASATLSVTDNGLTGDGSTPPALNTTGTVTANAVKVTGSPHTGYVLTDSGGGVATWAPGVTSGIASVTAGTGLTGGGSSGAIGLALASPVALANGGAGADLSATGPGWLKQVSTGSAVTVAAIAPGDIGAAPTNHAVNASTYGYGDTVNAGHLRVGNGLSVTTGTVSVDPTKTAMLDANGRLTNSTTVNVAPGNGNVSGRVIAGTCGATLSAGQVAYFAAADSRWYPAKADASATSGPVKIAMVISGGTAGTSCTLDDRGPMEITGWSLTTGALYYVSDATAGAITATPVSTAGSQVRAIGHALSATVLDVEPTPDFGEKAPDWTVVQDKGGQVYNVKAYGALGDGSHDDTTAIQAAINACVAAPGGTVYLPTGYYKISSTLVVQNTRGVTIQGAGGSYNLSGYGAATTLFWAGPTSETMVKLFDVASGLKVSGIGFDGGSTTGVECLLVDSDNGYSVTNGVALSDLHFGRAAVGIHIGTSGVSGYESDGIWIDRIMTHEMLAGSIAVLLNSANASFVNIANSTLRSVATGVSINAYGGPLRMVNVTGSGISGVGDFVYVNGPRGTIQMDMCQIESATNFFREGATAASQGDPITLIGNTIDLPMVFTVNTQVTSMGNDIRGTTISLGNVGVSWTSIADYISTGGITPGAGDVVTFISKAGTPNVFSTTWSSLVLSQTGGTYGASSLTLMNGTGSAGGLFTNSGLDLCDLGFVGSGAVQNNIRMEHRSGNIQNSASTTGEMQFVRASDSTFGSVGPAGARFLGAVSPRTWTHLRERRQQQPHDSRQFVPADHRANRRLRGWRAHARKRRPTADDLQHDGAGHDDHERGRKQHGGEPDQDADLEPMSCCAPGPRRRR